MFPATDPSAPRDYLELPAEPETGKRCPEQNPSLPCLASGAGVPAVRRGRMDFTGARGRAVAGRPC